MDYFHNISVVNTQYERIPINAVHMAILILNIQPWKWDYFSQVYLRLLVYLRKFLWNTHFLTFCGIHISHPAKTAVPLHSQPEWRFTRNATRAWSWEGRLFSQGPTCFLTFYLSIYCLDFKWFAMTGKTCFGSATLKSAQNFKPEKKHFVEGEWWTMGGVWPHGYCTCLWMSSSLGSSPGWGHCAVFWDTTLYSLSASLSTQVYKWVLANLNAGDNPVMD